MGKKNYSAAPLPFMGQKRRFAKSVQKLVIEEFSDKTVFIDLFGGSGLLAHVVKQVRPDATVIYNDFDNFSERLGNVDITNSILAELR